MSDEFLSRDEILNADDLQYDVVEVPEWGSGKKVRIRSLTGTERDAWEATVMVTGKDGKQKMNMQNIRSKLCCLTIVDGSGNALFTFADVDLLGKKSAAALARVFEASSRLSQITKADVDELVGNSENSQLEDS